MIPRACVDLREDVAGLVTGVGTFESLGDLDGSKGRGRSDPSLAETSIAVSRRLPWDDERNQGLAASVSWRVEFCNLRSLPKQL